MAEELHAAPEESAASVPQIPQGLFSDPALLQRLVSVVGALQSAPPPPSAPTPPSASASANLPADGLSKVLSDPALLEKLPQIMSAIGPVLAANAPPKSDAVPTAVLPHSPTADRDNLLLAIKPFLSAGRRDAVDTILRLEKLGDFFRSQHK